MKRSHLIAAVPVLGGLVVVGLTTTHPLVAQDGPPQPPAGRWQISHSEITFSEDPEDYARNTILLDTATGESWMLWTSDDPGLNYQWVQLKRSTDDPARPHGPADPARRAD